jgi:uncharacterized protein YktA (UPF0223 family)
VEESNNEFKSAIANVMDSAIDSLLEVIQFDETIEHYYTKNLSKEQAEEIIRWFNDEVIPLYTELEMFEKAAKAKKIKDTIKKYNENIH